MSRLSSVSVLCGLAFIATACGTTKTVTVAETETVTVSETEPAPDANAPQPAPPANQPGVTVRQIGETGIDDGVAYRVLSVKDVASLPVDEFSDPVTAVRGAKLVRADLVVKNNMKVPLESAFCGSQNAVLVDQKDREYNIHEDNLNIANNNECEEIAPGFQTHVILAFQVPVDSSVDHLSVWNSSSDDYSGETFVRFMK